MTRHKFSTAILPAGLDEWKRRVLWHDLFVEVIGPCDISFDTDRPAAVEFTSTRIGRIAVGEYRGTMNAVARTGRHTGEGGLPYFNLAYNSGDSDWFHNLVGRDVRVRPGELMLFDAMVPTVFQATDTASFRTLVIPKQLLRDVVPSVDDLAHNALEDTATIRLLKGYIDLLCGDEQLADEPVLAAHIDAVLLDLAALAVGAAGDAAELARMRGLRAARLQAIIARIRAGFADPAFSSDQVALELGVSRRYVNDILQESGLTLTERVLELRLQKARSMLAGSRHDRLKVSDVALACGFNEVSYFNRCFRRRFGASPTMYRGKSDPQE